MCNVKTTKIGTFYLHFTVLRLVQLRRTRTHVARKKTCVCGRDDRCPKRGVVVHNHHPSTLPPLLCASGKETGVVRRSSSSRQPSRLSHSYVVSRCTLTTQNVCLLEIHFLAAAGLGHSGPGFFYGLTVSDVATNLARGSNPHGNDYHDACHYRKGISRHHRQTNRP